MRISHHNTNLPANLVQPVFLLFPPAFLALFPLRSLNCSRAYVEPVLTLITLSTRPDEPLPSFRSLIPIDEKLSGGWGFGWGCAITVWLSVSNTSRRGRVVRLALRKSCTLFPYSALHVSWLANSTLKRAPERGLRFPTSPLPFQGSESR